MRSFISISLLMLALGCSQKHQKLEISNEAKSKSASSEKEIPKKSPNDIFNTIPMANAPDRVPLPVIEDIKVVPKETPVVVEPPIVVEPPVEIPVKVEVPVKVEIPPEKIDPVMLTSFKTIVSEADFDKMFPTRNAFYTYAGLAAAVDELDVFAKTGDNDTRKREVAAFLANVGHETGDLKYLREQSSIPGQYTDASIPATVGKEYMGRGPLQIKWNKTYKEAGDFLKVDLIANPEMIETDAKITWKSAIWYWIFSKGDAKMSAHEAITTGAGFGETIRAINRTGECTGNEKDARIQSRITRYKKYSEQLGLIADLVKLGC